MGGGKAAAHVDPILFYDSFEASPFCFVYSFVESPPVDKGMYRNVSTPTAIIYSSYITLFLHSFYTRAPPSDLKTHRWGLFHALDRHLVPNECPDVVDPVPMCGEFPVLNGRAWAKYDVVDRIHT